MYRLILLLTSLTTMVINPSFGCGPSSFQFGEAEMHAAVNGRWRIGWNTAGGVSSVVTVDISGAAEGKDGGSAIYLRRHPEFIRSAAACESRTFFVRSAGACSDDTRMALSVRYVDGDNVYESGPTEAMFWVSGLEFKMGVLQLAFGATTADIQVHPNGTVVWTRGSLNGIAASEVTVTAARISL